VDHPDAFDPSGWVAHLPGGTFPALTALIRAEKVADFIPKNLVLFSDSDFERYKQ